MNQPTATEQDVIAAAQASRARCSCGEIHDDGGEVPPATVGRIRGYLTAHPGHQLSIDETGTFAIIVLSDLVPPQVLATSGDLDELLDSVGAPAAEALS